MKAIASVAMSSRQAVALLGVAALILLPGIWIVWSLYASSVVAETVRSQSAALAGLNERLAALSAGQGSSALADAPSVFLPGATPAIAAAALQALVANTIGAAGGRILESEFAPIVDGSGEDAGRVDLRVSFETEIVGLQKILFDIETGIPILVVRALSIQSPGAVEAAATASPPLRIETLVGGYWEAPE